MKRREGYSLLLLLLLYFLREKAVRMKAVGGLAWFPGRFILDPQIQEEIETTKKQRKRVMRKQEYGRQLDRQREDIHPPHVLETLATFQPPVPTSLRLPEAKPDPDGEYPVQILPIRPFKTENDA